MRIKRPELLTFYFRQRQEGDLQALLRGEIVVTTRPELVAVTVLDGEEHPLTEPELTAITRLPPDWIDLDTIEPAADRALVAGLAERGVLLSDAADEDMALRRRRAAELEATSWDHHAAVYHYTSRWEGRSYDRSLPIAPVPIQQAFGDVAAPFDRAVEVFGPPPSAFRERDRQLSYVELPRPQVSGPLVDVLSERCTTRLFDREALMSLADFNAVLHTVWGAQGQARLSRDMVVLKKTSPSAGALHPVEVYPLVRRVEGLEAGIYHYDVAGHGLERIRAMEPGDMADLIEQITIGQSYFASAHVVFVLAARFQRTFWKYRNHSKAYRAVLFDAAHLSQTLFLVAADRKLGAFTTAAFNEVDIDEVLGLDPYREGTIALCGCGVKLAEGRGMTLAVQPYQPGREEP